jgi:hypothetical protein
MTAWFGNWRRKVSLIESTENRQRATRPDEVNIIGMQSIQSYKDLIVWQRGMNLVEAIYILTQRLPASEQWD